LQDMVYKLVPGLFKGKSLFCVAVQYVCVLAKRIACIV
jgi:hypothetical protein